ncbi:MAG: pilus assembly protein TadG-related protein [Acidimicrobiia bacterium]
MRCAGPGRRRAGDGGFVTAWTVALAVCCWGLVGLVIDGGRALRERSDAFGTAAAAARAGVQEIDERAAIAGQVRLDEDAARAAALGYLATRGFAGTVAVDGADVTVSVSGRTDLRVLVVPDSVGYAVSASARAVQAGGPP